MQVRRIKKARNDRIKMMLTGQVALDKSRSDGSLLLSQESRIVLDRLGFRLFAESAMMVPFSALRLAGITPEMVYWRGDKTMILLKKDQALLYKLIKAAI